MMYLVKFVLHKRYYMQHQYHTTNEYRLVVADNEEEAKDKLIKAFPSQEQCVYYDLEEIEVLETIQ